MSIDSFPHQATPKTFQNMIRPLAQDGSKPGVLAKTRTVETSSFLKRPGSPPETVTTSTPPKYSPNRANPSSAPVVASTSAEPPACDTRIIILDWTPDDDGDASSCEEDRLPGPRVAVPVQHEEPTLPTVPTSAEKAVVEEVSVDDKDEIRRRDIAITDAVREQNIGLLKKLLDAHPHAGPNPADKSLGTFIFGFFRRIASWFNGGASAWQGKGAVRLLDEAARVGNVGAINILLDRCMDLRKDLPMIAPALLEAVTSGKAQATELLLKKVLEIDPRYSPDVSLTAIAARNGHADVLEILVKNRMPLPWQAMPRPPLSQAKPWSRYGEAIGDYLCWSAANNQRAAAPEMLSYVAHIILKENGLNLSPEFGLHLNGGQRPLNSAQKACSVEAVVEVDAETYTKAGFTEETAKAMADGLNANARRHIARTGNNASATLARAVTGVFENFTANGEVWPNLRKYLMNKGMYGVLADLVVTALTSAADQSMAPGADREMLLAAALEESAKKARDRVHAAGNASGDPALFDTLLGPQLDLLIAYWHAQRAKHSAATTSKQPAPAAGDD